MVVGWPADTDRTDGDIFVHRAGAVIRAATANRSKRNEPLANNSRYKKLADLPSGGGGIVQRCYDCQTGRQVAIKLVPRPMHGDVKAVTRELLNQRACAGHPHIVQLQEVFPTEDRLAVVMDYADGGDLAAVVDRCSAGGRDGVPEAAARHLFQQLLVAVDYTHRLGIVNRDIKLDNLLLHGPWPAPSLRMCDFGVSKHETQSVCKSICGTPEYMAPETVMLANAQYNGRAADIWSCGVTLYVLVSGRFPFKRPGEEELPVALRVQRVLKRALAGDCAALPHVSLACQHLLSRMLQPEPGRRATMAELLAHPWVADAMPSALASLNDRLLSVDASDVQAGPQCQQSAREIVDIVSASARPADAAGGDSVRYRVQSANARLQGGAAFGEYGAVRGNNSPAYAAAAGGYVPSGPGWGRLSRNRGFVTRQLGGSVRQMSL